MSNTRNGKVAWVLLLALAACLAVGMGVGATPSPPPVFYGLESATDLGVGAGYVQPGDTQITQAVELTDSDDDAYDIIVKTVTIDNLGTAGAGDFASIEILDGAGTVLGIVNNPTSFPVTVDIDDLLIVDPGATPVSATLQVRVTVATGVTGHRTIRTRLTADHTESDLLTGTPFHISADDTTTTTINNPPTADAQAVTTDEDTPKAITLTGGDLDSDALTFSIESGPTHGTLSGTAPAVTYTPAANYNGADSFTFKVSDGMASSAGATVAITVTPVNDAPVANAGPDQAVDEGDPVTLDGSGSSDVDGDVLSYAWAQTVGPAVTLAGGNTASPTFTAPEVTTDTALTFQLTVDDGNGGADTDTVTITIQNIPCTAPPVAPSGLTGTAISGTQIDLSWTDNSDNETGFNIYRSMTASVSWRDLTPIATVAADTISYSDTELDSGVLYHYWVSAYNTCGESDRTSVVSVATPAGPVTGCWTDGFVLIQAAGAAATDNLGRFGVSPNADDCNDGSDIPHPPFSMAPTVSLWFELDDACQNYDTYAGDIKAPIDCGQSKTWAMIVRNDGDGAQTTISWDLSNANFGSCLTGVTLTDEVSGTAVDMLTQTEYTYTKDGNPETRHFTIEVECGGTPTSPVADAGVDQDVHVGTTAQLNGSGSQNATAYHWEFASMPEGSGATLSNADIVNPTFAVDLCGDYVVRLWAGSAGNWDSDTVTITAGNQAPVANAGADQTIQVADDNDDNVPDQATTVHLAGSGTDPDSDAITSWRWEWVSSPGASAPALSDDQIANPTFVATVYGDYVLRFQVDDGKPCNATSTWDQVTITVQEKPEFIFFDDMEHGTNGWHATGQWGLQADPDCCSNDMPSDSHAWCYGENGSYFRSGTLVSPAIDVTGLTSVDLSFWYCFTLASSRYRAYVSTEVSFGGRWIKVWPGATASGSWKQVGPTTIEVPASATTMRVRFNFQSTGGRGCYCIDDVMVAPGTPIAQYTIAVSANPLAGGTVTGGGTYNQGVSVTVNATANPGYEFVNWTEGGTQVSTDTSYSFAATGNRALVANFQAVPAHTLNVASTDGGSVTMPGEGIFTYNEGTVVNLVATPDAGYRFVNWTGDTVANANAASTTITMDDNHSVTANFEEVTSLFFDNMENGTNGWVATRQWHLQADPSCCSNDMPSDSHAWCYGENGSYFRSGRLTSRAIDIYGVDSVDLSFWYCFTLASSRYRAYVFTEVSFGGRWIKVWPGAAATANWRKVGPTAIAVPAGATTMRVRFNFESTGGRGCYCIDDVLVAPSGAAGALSYDAANADQNAPEFQVDSVQNTPNPVRDVHTTYFEVKGVGINLIEVQVFDQSGRSVFDSGWQPNGYEWHLETDSGETLANGIYLYVVTVMGYDGQTVVTQVKKLAVYR